MSYFTLTPSDLNTVTGKAGGALMPAKMEFFMGFAIEEGYEALIAKKPEGMNEGITSNPSGSWVEG